MDEIPTDGIKDVIEQVIDDPGAVATPMNVLLPALQNIIDAHIDGLEKFGECDNPCNDWYGETADALKAAAGGDCGGCAGIHATVAGAGNSNAQLCADEMLGVPMGESPHSNFASLSQALAAGCKTLCNQ
jgi:hypothetical protein